MGKVKDALFPDVDMRYRPEPFDEGEDAYLSGKSLDRCNPYNKTTRQYEEFVLGYKMAQKSDRDRLRGEEF
jgi:hypothetical protein